jgi:phosphatidylserine/phosphatidylglycerophosphate/cardiolipin synthase-like enzyme
MNKVIFFFLTILLFSCNKEKKAVVSTTFCSNYEHNDSISISNELLGLEENIKNKTGVYVLEDGGNAVLTRAWLCKYAEKSIDIQYFIFSTDNIGLIACDYLVRAADRGVKVRILLDDIMVEADIKEILSLDAHPNISIKIYNPGVNLGKNIFQKIKKFSTDFRGANQRMHNKTLTVDGKVVITGGRNIADEYFDFDHTYNFRDRDVLLLGKTVKKVATSFDLFWESKLSVNAIDITKEKIQIDKEQFNRLHEYACNPNNFWPQIREQIKELPKSFQKIKYSKNLIWTDSIDFISDLPGKNDNTSGLKGSGITTRALIKLVQNAKTTIDIQSPYLVTTELSQSLFKKAIDRGVKIRILTNSLASTDNVEAFGGYQKDRNTLLKIGIKIFEFKPNAKIRLKLMTSKLQDSLIKAPIFGLHAKSMVVDGNTSVIGTFNLDPRSANLNTECITIIHSKTIANSITKNIEEEIKPENSWETTLNFNPDSEVKNTKRLKTWSRKILPKGIL